MRRAVVLAALVFCGCPAGPATTDAGGTTADAPSDTPRDVGAGSDAGQTDAPLPTLDAPGEVVTTIRVVYSGTPGTITFRGSGGPFDWTTDVDATEAVGTTWVFQTTAITEPLEWKPLLDGAWARGPNYHVAPGDTIEVAPHFTAARPREVVLAPGFDSAFLPANHRVVVLLPPGYDENVAARYPVVFAQDGQNLFDPALTFGGMAWELDEAIDAAAEAGRCEGTTTACADDGECGVARCETFALPIVVATDNSVDRIDEYTPTIDADVADGGSADAYLRMLVDEIEPMVAAAYRARLDAEHTAILGSSLGGLLAAHAGVTRPDDFGLVVAMSPSTWWDARVILGEVATITTPRPLRVYVDSGDAGPSMDGVDDTAMLADAYRTLGYEDGTSLRYVVAPGHQHNETYWALRVRGALQFALGPREEHVAP